jgi:shikimate dehydrogenase
MGAVNTVKNVNGRLFGYNTDGNGFIKSLKSRDVSVKDKNIVIMGAGGSVRGISVKTAMEGAKSITILNRTLEKAQEICDIINDNIGNVCRSASLDMFTLEQHSKSCDILINTTPVGMAPYIHECPVEHLDFLTSDTVVCDLIYNPEETVFLSKAKERGCKAINGWGMLLFQAIDSFQIWTDKKVNSQLIEILQKINKK